jgi:hypothetical protein
MASCASMDLHEELGLLADALAREGIEYALCGGLAVAVHGFPRATKDIDLLIRPVDAARIVRAVEPIGYTLDAGEFSFGGCGPHARRVRRIGKTEGSEVLTLHLVLLPPWLAEVWESREVIEWEGRELTVVSREGLVSMKRIAGRPQDLADIAKLTEEADEVRSRAAPTVDMSPAAVDRRIREASELRRLCLSLARAGRLGPVRSRPS